MQPKNDIKIYAPTRDHWIVYFKVYQTAISSYLKVVLQQDIWKGENINSFIFILISVILKFLTFTLKII